MKTLDVVSVKSTLPSFAWNDGLFAVKKEENGTLYLWKIVDGKLDVFESGEPNIFCTSVSNTDITKTDLIAIVN